MRRDKSGGREVEHSNNSIKLPRPSLQIERNFSEQKKGEAEMECFAKQNVKRFSSQAGTGPGGSRSGKAEGLQHWHARHKCHKVREREKQIKLLHNERKNELHFNSSVQFLRLLFFKSTL